MKIRNTLLAATLFLTGLAASSFAADSYKLDPAHSFVIFKIQHVSAGNVWGRFNNPAGTVVMNDDAAKSSLNLTLDVNAIDTANKQRDGHLKTADFFNAAQFPTITFTSTSIKKLDASSWEVTGDLTIKGTKKPITVKLEKTGEGKGMQGETRLGLETTFSIKRADFGVDALPGAVGAEAHITIAIEAIKE